MLIAFIKLKIKKNNKIYFQIWKLQEKHLKIKNFKMFFILQALMPNSILMAAKYFQNRV